MEEEQRICHICLRTDRPLKRIDSHFIQFHYELCERTDNFKDTKVCNQCELLLKKSFNFKQMCYLSRRILIAHNMKKLEVPFNRLFELLQVSIDHSSNNDTILHDLISNNTQLVSQDTEKIHSSRNVNSRHVETKSDVCAKLALLSKHANNLCSDITDLDTVKKERDMPNLEGYDDNINLNDEILNEDSTRKACRSLNESVSDSVDCDVKRETNDTTDGDESMTSEIGDCFSNSKANVIKYNNKLEVIEKVRANDARPIDDREYEVNMDSKENCEIPKKSVCKLGGLSFMNAGTSSESKEQCNKNNFDCTFPRIVIVNKKSNKRYICEPRTVNNCNLINPVTSNSCGTCTKEKAFASDKCGSDENVSEIKSHAKENPFSCSMCDYRSNRKSNFISHIKTHAKGEIFACDNCDRIFLSKNNLIIHLRSHETERKFACELCNYTTDYKKFLMIHVATHTKTKRFACDQCDYRCVSKDKLVIHLRTHTKEKPFACDQCDYKCNQKIHLQHHQMKAHIGEMPFACNQCKYKCLSKSSLMVHVRTHTKEKPFACDRCDYRCNQKIHLKHHYFRIHEREMPFSCQKCSYQCLNKSSLVVHLRTHTKEKPFACDLCDYKCNQKIHLKHHYSKEHANNSRLKS